MLKKTLIGAIALAFAAGSAGATSAFAAGQVEQGNGRSICRFSGLNDTPDAEFPEGGRVQSFGQLIKQLSPDAAREEFGTVGVPGIECNPNTGPDLHAGG